MPYRWASSLLCNEVCVRFSAHKPFVNQTQYVWAIMSTCSLRAFFRFLTGGAEFTLAVSLKFNFCFHLKRGTEIFHSKQFLKWNQRSDNSGGNTQWDYRMWTEVGYIQWLFIHNKSYLNCRLMRPMFCSQRKSTKVLNILLILEQIQKTKKNLGVFLFLTWRRKPTTYSFFSSSFGMLCLHPTLPSASSSLTATKFTSSSSISTRLLCGLPLDLLSISSSLSILQYIHCHVQTISVWPLFLYLQNMQHVLSLWCPHPDPLHPGPF